MLLKYEDIFKGKRRYFRAYSPDLDVWWTNEEFGDFNREHIFFLEVCPYGKRDVNMTVMHWVNYDGLPFYSPREEAKVIKFYDAILMEWVGTHYEGDVLKNGEVIGNVYDGTEGEYEPILNSLNYLTMFHGGPIGGKNE